MEKPMVLQIKEFKESAAEVDDFEGESAFLR